MMLVRIVRLFVVVWAFCWLLVIGGPAHARGTYEQTYYGQEVIGGFEFHGFGFHRADRVMKVATHDLERLYAESDLIFIGINEQPRVVGLSEFRVPDDYETKGRILEANVRIYDVIKRKRDAHAKGLKFVRLQWRSRSLMGPCLQTLFFVRRDIGPDKRTRWHVLRAARVSPYSLTIKVLRIRSRAIDSEEIGPELAKAFRFSPPEMHLITLLEPELARPAWREALRSRRLDNYTYLRRFGILARDIVARGNDEDIRALLKLCPGQIETFGKPLHQSAFYRMAQFLVFDLLRLQGGDRMTRLLIEHVDNHPTAAVSTAFALAEIGGDDAREAIKRWRADNKIAKQSMPVQSVFGQWQTTPYADLLDTALDRLEKKIKQSREPLLESDSTDTASDRQSTHAAAAVAGKRPAEKRSHSGTVEQIREWIAQLDDGNDTVRKLALHRLVLAGEPAVAIVRELSSDDAETRARAERILAMIRTARYVRWLGYIGVDCGIENERITSIGFGFDSVLGSDDMDAAMGVIKNIKSLKRLTLGRTKVTAAGIRHLAELTSLESLHLNNTNITNDELVHIKGLTSLKYLNLGANRDISDAGLAHLSELISLEWLRLNSTNIKGPGLAHLKRLGSLKHLGLYYSAVTDASHLKDIQGLEELELQGTKLTDDGLTGINRLSSLRRLFLKATPISDAGLAHLKGLKSLETLSLGGTKITDAGLAHLRDIRSLRDLSLGRCEITDAGLAHLEQLDSLECLWLANTPITDSGLAHLKKLGALRSLQLSDDEGITDAGLVHLKEFKSLQKLWIYRTGITSGGRAQLRKSLPNCAILR